MTYHPGDAWAICDLSGKKVLMSQTRKTWDGLRVWERLWYPKHPQLSVRAIPERSLVVKDARPRPADVPYPKQPTNGAFCLISPAGIDWTFSIEDDGALTPTQITWGRAYQQVELVLGYLFTVNDPGDLHVSIGPARSITRPWKMFSPSGYVYGLTVDSGDLALLVTLLESPTVCDVDPYKHSWDIDDVVCTVDSRVPYNAEGAITQSGEEVWMEV
jgi:hypothetical protein